MNGHEAAVHFRAAMILFAGMASMLLLALVLILGHLLGKFDLWLIWVDYRTKQAGWRLIAESFAFVVTSTALLVSSVRGGDDLPWVLAIYIGAWVVRSLLGPIVAAKAGAMHAIGRATAGSVRAGASVGSGGGRIGPE